MAKDGRFGVYVTDGETNASLTKGDRLEAMSNERAYELLAIRREQVIEKGGPRQEGRRHQEGRGQEDRRQEDRRRQEGRRQEGRGQEGRGQ